MIKNAIVVMFDSLQYNYVGCYGNDWIKTPNMDRFAREGALFENCYSEGLPTIPCRRAMHTGRFTLQKSGWVALSMEDTTIADLCWGRPIDTAMIYDSAPTRLMKFGYSRGFDKVWFLHGHEGDSHFWCNDPLLHFKAEDYLEDHVMAEADRAVGEKVIKPLIGELTDYLQQRQEWRTEDDRYVAKTMRKAVDYLEQVDRNKQFFLWIDSFDPHEPWDPPSVYMNFPCPYNPDYKGKDQFLPVMGPVEGVYTEPELHHIRMLYAELVTVCDNWFGYLLDNVRRMGLEQNTLIMMVSDHGEPMGNGEHGHGIMRKCRPWPYEELVHTPMLMRGPGIPAGRRVKGFVQSCDVAPTVCDWLGIGVHPDMQGKSLLALAKGEVEKVRDFAIAGYHKFSWAIFTEEWSFIHWLRKGDDEGNSALAYAIYGEGTLAAGGAAILNIGMSSSTNSAPGDDAGAAMTDAMAEYKAAASLDGEEQWTCTPGSVAELPAKDELYNRRTDPFQLNNVAAKHPEIAKELFQTLREYMAELRAS